MIPFRLPALRTSDRANHPGVVLIMVAGVLTLLSAVGFTFFVLTQGATQSSIRYSDMVRAELLAHSGVSEAITRLRQHAYLKTESASDSWYPVDWMKNGRERLSFAYANGKDDDGDGIVDNESGETPAPYTRALSSSIEKDSDRFLVDVKDAASKININACDNLALVLNNLCTLLGSPLMPADEDLLQPRRWYIESGNALTTYGANTQDTATELDIYYMLDGQGRPIQRNQAPYNTILPSLGKTVDGRAVFGDGYAIAGYRSRYGTFSSLEQIKSALTFVDRNGNGIADDPLEQLEIELKYALLRPHITTHSWIDTNTSCVGKFEWCTPVTSPMMLPVRDLQDGSVSEVPCQVLIDRDKSWVADKPESDPQNLRGSLRGSYVSIINGHGAGQLRRIATNGTDWIALRGYGGTPDESMTVPPGPISSYMIVAREDALLDEIHTASGDYIGLLPQVSGGHLIDDPKIDYTRAPLCIHRAPVNLNTASDKVLAALFMGMNVQHGHPMSVGTDADKEKLFPSTLKSSAAWTSTDTDWEVADACQIEPYLLTPKGLKRIPADTGKLTFDRPTPNATNDFAYLNNNGSLDPGGTTNVNEAVELAYRIIVARQTDPSNPTLQYIDPLTGHAAATGGNAYKRGPFRSWDDLFFRVVQPWDDQRRATNPAKISIARMIMAHFNTNTDLLKFNPNVEWIDRWGRNFTELEPVMVYSNDPAGTSNPQPADPVLNSSIPIYATDAKTYDYLGWVSTISLKSFGGLGYKDGGYITRTFRYRSMELIDKSDLNRSTTEFTFDSGGIYEITSTGQVQRESQLYAERRVEAIVKVYDVWRESTQKQFIEGTISAGAAGMGAPGTGYSGQIARDAVNVNQRLPLNTLPEPLVPLGYTLTKSAGTANTEAVDTSVGVGNKRNVFGDTVSVTQPDVLANRILPAAYDGQVVLATNTSGYDTTTDQDTFLATFDGDLDTIHAQGNGHEQAKSPNDCKTRVVDTCGLLGILNDKKVDFDPDLAPPNGTGARRKVYWFSVLDQALRGLNPDYYWNNVTLRTGDLRTDGVYLTGPGVAGNDGTLKYLLEDNFDPGSTSGGIVSMWLKPAWHHNDRRRHQLFNASNPGEIWQARGCFLVKDGKYIFSNPTDDQGWGYSGAGAKLNDLIFDYEGPNGNPPGATDNETTGCLHGGDNRVNVNGQSPGYRVQPFRWHFTGARYRYNLNTMPFPNGDTGSRGYWAQGGYTDAVKNHIVANYSRPFIDTQTFPEGPNWNDKLFWSLRGNNIATQLYACDIGAPGAVDPKYGRTGQDVVWSWADGGPNTEKCFSINNLNYDDYSLIYRYMPEEGAFTVIDELKLSRKDTVLASSGYADDRIVRWNGTSGRPEGEMYTSRYYLPPNPADRANCPTFTSQTLLQSAKGYSTVSAGEYITLVRVTWTVFTPRFLHEHKIASGSFSRSCLYANTNIGGTTNFKGPFDYDKYNKEYSASGATDAAVFPFGVKRPNPADYGIQSHATKGVEVELLDRGTIIPGFENSTGSFVATNVFTDPDVVNRFGTDANPVKVRASDLRYRVRFRYPMDPLVDTTAGLSDDRTPAVKTINPSDHYLLDTPVFDDISVTYMVKPRVMEYREVTE